MSWLHDFDLEGSDEEPIKIEKFLRAFRPMETYCRKCGNALQCSKKQTLQHSQDTLRSFPDEGPLLETLIFLRSVTVVVNLLTFYLKSGYGCSVVIW